MAKKTADDRHAIMAGEKPDPAERVENLLRRREEFRPIDNVAISLRAESPDAKSSWIQLAKSGKWRGHRDGDILFDAKVYDQIVANLSRNPNGEIPLDFEHASEQGADWGVAASGAPAQGWIKELRHDGEVLEGRVEWVDKQPGRGYVRDGAYKYISPAVIFESVDRISGKGIGAEMTSAALTNRPFLEGMRPVTARAKETKTMATKIEKPNPFAPDDDGMSDDDKKAKSMARSAECADMRSASTRMSANYTAIIAAICEELCETIGYSAFLVEVYDDHAIYQTGYGSRAKKWSVPYTYDGEEASLGEAVAVRTQYVPENKENIAMSQNGTATEVPGKLLTVIEEVGSVGGAKKLLRAKLGLPEGASDLDMLDSVAKLGGSLESLKMRADAGDQIVTALSLAPSSSAADVKKRIESLLAIEKQHVALLPEVTTLRDAKKKSDEALGEAEVSYIIQHGKQYNLEVGAGSKAAMLRDRRANPEEFEKDYKPALEGMRKGDHPALFRNETGPGGKLAAPAPEQMSGRFDRQLPGDFEDEAGDDDPNGGNAAFEKDVDDEIATAKAAGRVLMRGEAMTVVQTRYLSAIR